MLPIVFAKFSLGYDYTQFKLNKSKRMYAFFWDMIKIID